MRSFSAKCKTEWYSVYRRAAANGRSRLSDLVGAAPASPLRGDKRSTTPFYTFRAVFITFTPLKRLVLEPWLTADTCEGWPLPSKNEPNSR